MVTGRLRQRDYEAADGTRRTVYETGADDAGPSPRFAAAKVTRTTRDKAPHPAGAASQWASPPAAGTAAAPGGDQPPF